MNSLQSSLLVGATVFTLATATETEAAPQSIVLDSAGKVTHVLADTTKSGEKSWGEVLGETALFGTFCFLMYKLTAGRKR